MIKSVIINLYMIICRILFRVNKRTVLFESFSGKTYSDNPRALSEMMHLVKPELKILWVFNEPKEKEGKIPKYVKTIRKGSFSYYKNLACCKIFVSNNNLPLVNKGKEQIFVQAWHGDRPIKKILHESKFASAKFKVSEEIEGYCDYAIAGSTAGEKQFRNAFRYNGEILSFGTPRNDILLNNSQEQTQEIKAKINVNNEDKLILFAPTLRRKYGSSSEKQDANNIDITSLLNTLEKQSGQMWKCLLRAHPAMSGISNESIDSRIIDLTTYEDMADLLLVSDMLITDYSSSAGDFALLNRPVILYQEDLCRYLAEDRNLCFDMKEGPFMVANDQKQLEKLVEDIVKGEKINIYENCKQILEFFGDFETGRASVEIIKVLFDEKENK